MAPTRTSARWAESPAARTARHQMIPWTMTWPRSRRRARRCRACRGETRRRGGAVVDGVACPGRAARAFRVRRRSGRRGCLAARHCHCCCRPRAQRWAWHDSADPTVARSAARTPAARRAARPFVPAPEFRFFHGVDGAGASCRAAGHPVRAPAHDPRRSAQRPAGIPAHLAAGRGYRDGVRENGGAVRPILTRPVDPAAGHGQDQDRRCATSDVPSCDAAIAVDRAAWPTRRARGRSSSAGARIR